MKKKKKPPFKIKKDICKLTYEEIYINFNNKFKYISNYFLSKNNVDYLTPKIFLAFYNDKNLIPFWNKKIELLSNEIFMPSYENIKTDLRYNLKFNKNKWFESDFCISTNKENKNISYIPNKDNFEEASIITRKISFYPNKEQKYVLKSLFGIYRYFYNRTIQFLNNYKKSKSFYLVKHMDIKSKKDFDIPDKNIYSLYTLRKYIKCNYPEWMNKIKLPSHGIDCAISEAVKNITTCFNVKKKNNKSFKMTYKSKKDIIQTMNIEKTSLSINKNTIFAGMKVDEEYIFKNGINLKEKISKFDYCDSSLSYDIRLNKFYLNLSHKVKNKENNNNKVCAIDPGIKNFLTIYDESSAAKIGINCGKTMNKLNTEIDIIKSHIYSKKYIINDKEENINANRRRNLKKALRRKIIKLENIRNELHNQSINYLTNKYSRIILSPFESQKIDKILSSPQTRILKSLSYYKFKERLKEKAKRVNVKVDIREEYYTSITCTKCGNIDYNLGNKDKYKCKECNIHLERDYNGARNILLRNINT